MRRTVSLLILGFCATKLFVAVSILRFQQVRMRRSMVPSSVALIRSEDEKRVPEIKELTHLDTDFWNQGEVPWDVHDNDTFVKNKPKPIKPIVPTSICLK